MNFVPPKNVKELLECEIILNFETQSLYDIKAKRDLEESWDTMKKQLQRSNRMKEQAECDWIEKAS